MAVVLAGSIVGGIAGSAVANTFDEELGNVPNEKFYDKAKKSECALGVVGRLC